MAAGQDLDETEERLFRHDSGTLTNPPAKSTRRVRLLPFLDTDRKYQDKPPAIRRDLESPGVGGTKIALKPHKLAVPTHRPEGKL